MKHECRLYRVRIATLTTSQSTRSGLPASGRNLIVKELTSVSYCPSVLLMG